MKFCSQCGQQLPDEARFCGSCGITVTEPANASAETVAMQNLQPGQVADDPQTAYANQQSDDYAQASTFGSPLDLPQKRGLGTIGKVAIASVLSLFIIGGGLWGWWNMNTESRVQSKLNLAVKYLSENDYEKAVLAYNDVIKIEPREAMAYQGLAKIYTLQGKYEKANSTYERGLNTVSSKDKLSLQLSQAGMYIDQNKLAAAEKYLQAIIAEKADCIEAYEGLSMVYRLQNDSEKARQIIEQALDKNPRSYEAVNLLARFIMSEDQEKTLDLLLKSLQLEPDQQEAFAIMNDMYAGDWVALLAKLEESNKSNAAALLKLYVYDQMKDYRKLVSLYENEFVNDQASLKPIVLAAISYYQLGDRIKAEELINHTVKANPNAWILADIAWYYRATGNNEQALAYVNMAFETGADNLEALKLLSKALEGSKQQDLTKYMTAMQIISNWRPIIYINKELVKENIEPCFKINGNEGWPGDIKGQITDVDNGAAISGAMLEIYNTKGELVSRIVTDSYGKYNASLSAGDYRLQIKALFYVSKELADFKVSKDEDRVFNQTLKKSETASGLKGLIQDASNRAPIANAKIDVFAGNNKKLSTIRSDAQGKFELLLLPATDYTIKISKEGYLGETYEGIAITPANTVFLETILQVQTGAAKGSFNGHIYNALNGNGVGNLTIDFRRGINNIAGNDVAFTVKTNTDGSYQIKDVKPGNYTGEARGDGYVKANFTAVCVGGQLTAKQDGTITPELPAGQTRIVLSWGQSPHDLDAHLTGPRDDGGRFNVYYSNRRNGDYVDLDIDDTSSYGPETITIRNQIAGIYRFSVHDYSNHGSNASSRLSGSGAKVQVFRGSEPVQVFYVPANMGGTLWEVFEINDNTLVPINRLSYHAESSTVP